ncbi:MAG: HAD-IA family hydrolase [Pseudomonadota bacterium]
MTQALLFGGIGTLLETSELQRAAFNAAFVEAGLDWHWREDEYRAMLQTPGGIKRIVDFARRQGNVDIDERAAAELHANKSRLFHERLAAGQLQARPGVLRLVRGCRENGIALGFATTTYAATAQAVLTAIGLSSADFDVIMHRSLVENAKPDGEVYTRCLAALRVDAQQALAVEDSESGLASAAAAGVPCIVTPGTNTSTQDFSAALTIVSHLGDIGNPYRWLGGAQPGTVDVIEFNSWLDAA